MNDFIQFLIVFDLICFGVYFGGDIVCTALAKVRKKTDEEEFEIYKVEDDTDAFRPDRAGADGGPVPVLRPDWLSQRGSPDG